MASPSHTLASLRQLLAERYPQEARGIAQTLATGLPAIDENAGGIPCGAITEIVCAAPSCGSQLLIGELLRALRQTRGRAALIDASNSFDPESWPGELLELLVWARCREINQAMQAADVFARDGNFRLVLLDLRSRPAGELKRQPATLWYRLQRAAESAELALCVLTPQAHVPSARLRMRLARSHALPALNENRTALALALSPEMQRQRRAASA